MNPAAICDPGTVRFQFEDDRSGGTISGRRRVFGRSFVNRDTQPASPRQRRRHEIAAREDGKMPAHIQPRPFEPVMKEPLMVLEPVSELKFPLSPKICWPNRSLDMVKVRAEVLGKMVEVCPSML